MAEPITTAAEATIDLLECVLRQHGYLWAARATHYVHTHRMTGQWQEWADLRNSAEHERRMDAVHESTVQARADRSKG